MPTRVLVAYSIIAIVVAVAIPTIVIRLQRRKRAKLRRRGVKTFEHRSRA